MPQPDIVFVLGMHRSGTSLLAEALHRAGLAVGRQMIADEPAINARGFWEDRRVVEINEEVLAAFNSSWFDIAALPPHWEHNQSLSALLKEATELLRQDYAPSSPAVIKDPRMCRLLPFWQRATEDCGLSMASILLLRSPLSVAHSLWRRNRLPLGYSLLLWLRYNLEAEQTSQAHRRLIVDYDSLLEGGVQEFQQVVAGLGISSAVGSNELIQAFDPTLRHHNPPEEKSGAGLIELQALADAQYRRLLSGTPSRSSGSVGLMLPPAEELLELCAELAAEQLASQSELIRIGELHGQALELIQERDDQLERRNRDCEYAEAIVKQRDAELIKRNADCAYNETIVRERDSQLAQRNQDCARAETLAREQQEQATALHERLEKIRALPLGRLALRCLDWLDRRR